MHFRCWRYWAQNVFTYLPQHRKISERNSSLEFSQFGHLISKLNLLDFFNFGGNVFYKNVVCKILVAKIFLKWQWLHLSELLSVQLFPSWNFILIQIMVFQTCPLIGRATSLHHQIRVSLQSYFKELIFILFCII